MPSVDEVVALVREWLAEPDATPLDPGADRLAAMLRDPAGLPFTVGFIDRVIRPEDPRVAARSLAQLARRPPGFLPPALRAAVQLGAIAGRGAPALMIPVARSRLRSMVAHLVIDAREDRLGEAVARLRADGTRLNLNLLGEAVLGEREANRRLDRTRALLERDDVDYVSIKVSATVAPHSPWAFEETVESVCERLLPLFHAAARATPAKFINLDMEEYRDLAPTIAAFTRLLDRDDLLGLQAGIVLQAYLPDALRAMIDLQNWAAARRARGGAPIKVRLVKGANLPMERVDAVLHGWPLATWDRKRDTDANYKRVLDYALTAERAASVRVGVAGHNLFDVAFAWLLAGERGVRDAVEFEMLLGMAGGEARAVSRTVGPLRLYTPVVHPAEFDVAIAYLVRRLEEGSSADNFLSAAYELGSDPALFERERERFAASLAEAEALLDEPVPEPRRAQDRSVAGSEVAGSEVAGSEAAEGEVAPAGPAAFANAPDSDPSVAANRRWAYRTLGRVGISTLGVEEAGAALVDSATGLDSLLAVASEAGRRWGARPAAERAALLRSAAAELGRRRGELIEVMAAEGGKTFDQADPEVSEAVDFARYYASLALGLDAIDGAEPVPVGVTLVAPPWNFPVSIPAGCVLGALAAGSAVVLKPAPQAIRCGAVLASALWSAGIPREVLQLVDLDEGSLGAALVGDRRIGRVILTGAYETAKLFLSLRPELALLAETSGKNAITITPSADLDLAVRDLVASAFGNAGQKCSAASLAILVGQVAESPRFHRQLVDAVGSLHVAYPDDPRAQVGPLIEPASGKLERALETLEPGESWLVEPRRLDEPGRLWSPGVRAGVAPWSWFHLTECFGPVLGLMRARDLDEAIALQNGVPYGLTAGLHSLDRTEIGRWLDRVRAGNLYVNRGITGAIVRRQPFGGWKRSSVGPGCKAGGPNYLLSLSDWVPAPSRATAPLGPVAERALEVAAELELAVDRLEAALRSDAAAMASEYGRVLDVSGLGVERNLLRYLPATVEIRSDAGADWWALVRVTAAGAVAGADVSVSCATSLPIGVSRLLARYGFPVVVESGRAWLARIESRPAGRVRYLASGAVLGGGRGVLGTGGGGVPDEVWRACAQRPDVTLYGRCVTESGRLELLPFLLEQSVSITAHRFGTPDPVVLGPRLPVSVDSSTTISGDVRDDP